MNPMGLMEMAQINEQEHMREALRRTALREARKQAGITWFQALRMRFFSRSIGVTAAPAAAAPVAPAAPVAEPLSVAPEATSTPVLVHEVRIRKPVSLTSGGAARASAPAPQLRVVRAAEADCVTAE